MIDSLVLCCDFMKSWIVFDLQELGIPLKAEIDPITREAQSLHHAWESIPSSFGSLTMKVFYHPTSKNRPDPWIEIKDSPAKIMQGHNIFGSDDLGKCAYALIETLYKAYPGLVGKLDPSSWTVAEIDITYHSRADSNREANQFITALQHVSKGQTKSRTGFNGTTYFGKKNSRIKKINVYDKNAEVIAYMEREKRRGDPLKVLPN